MNKTLSLSLYSTLLFGFALLGLTHHATAQTMSRQDKLFIQKGIQYPSWVRNEHASFAVPVPTRQKLTINRTGRYIRMQLPNTEILSIAELQVFSGGVNIAPSKPTQQSSNKSGGGGLSNVAVDGNTNGDYFGGSVTCTIESYAQMEPWWQVDLSAVVTIDSIVIWNRTDGVGTSTSGGANQRMKGYYLLVSDNAFTGTTLASSLGQSGVSHYTQPLTGFVNRYPSASELKNAYMTPMYFEIPTYNYEIHQQDPSLWWGIAKGAKPVFPAPEVNRGPSAFEQSNGFLNSLQTANLNKMYSICIGDEEPYSTTFTGIAKSWFDVIRAKYPDVLFHTNQYRGQWTDAQIRTYMQTAQPDLLTLDFYYFNYVFGPGPTAGNSYTRLYNDMSVYRRLALGGYDGTGTAPIPFGGYVQAFAGDNPSVPQYRPSESEINLNTFTYLTLGAKWVNVWIYYALFWDGTNVTPQYHQYSKVGKAVNKLSPHLSRLRTSDVRFIAGQNSGGANQRPSEIPAWTTTADPYVTGITATNLGTFNGGLKGDVMVGYFKPVPGINSTSGISMAPLEHKDARYFMLLNGLTKPNGPANNSVDTVQGKANLVRQKIVMNIDFGSSSKDTLYRINNNNGAVEMVNLSLVSGSQYTYTDTLDGGVANLFYWKNQGKPAPVAAKSLRTTTSYVNAGNVTQLNGTNKFTAEAWVNFNATTVGATVFCKELNLGQRLLLIVGPNNILYATVANGANAYGYTAVNTIAANQWYHLAMVYDGTLSGNANRVKLFVNGVQKTLTFDGTIPATTSNNTSPLILGSTNTTATNAYLNGTIDEFRMWNTALTGATITAWKDKALGSCHPNIANLQVYYPFTNSINATVAVAELGTTYTGTITNAVYLGAGQANGASGCSGSMMSTNNQTPMQLQAMGNELKASKTIIYPNPVEGKLTVEVYRPIAETVVLSVFNSVGQHIYRANKNLESGSNQVVIDFSNWQSGVYILRIKDAQGEEQFKVIKQ